MTSQTCHYVVANELIAEHLARALLLPIPPGFIIEHKGKPHYVSLNFNLSGEDLPPANPQAAAVPDFYIQEVVEAAVDVGLPKEATKPGFEFLRTRRTKLLQLLKEQPAAFPKIPTNKWNQI
ncbi:MAG: hypothetical protein H6729_08540 [Deltaproteobacteria bacterium]|nr:hypothetical protein [Deltaproteobacteria bacterium]